MTTRPINGTQKADVYSFAIVLQEIVFRAEPYFIDIDPPQCMGPHYNFVKDSFVMCFGAQFIASEVIFRLRVTRREGAKVKVWIKDN